jgi:hypothetical protein
VQKLTNRKFYYGWVVVWVVFSALLVSAGVRAAPTVLINPLESELGWGRAAISAAVSIGLLLYGLSGPAAGRADGPLWPQAPYAFRTQPYRLEHVAGRGDDRAMAAQPVLGGT